MKKNKKQKHFDLKHRCIFSLFKAEIYMYDGQRYRSSVVPPLFFQLLKTQYCIQSKERSFAVNNSCLVYILDDLIKPLFEYDSLLEAWLLYICIIDSCVYFYNLYRRGLE